MPYQINSIAGTDGERLELSEFLAAFVRDGELPYPRPGDDDPSVWMRRMRWWWDENPNCRPDSPRGFLLRHGGDGLVGFSGFIPFTYECGGDEIPTLVTTTLFVRSRHRCAVMGLVARQRELGRSHQIIDGSPSPEMCRLLEKLGYKHAGDRSQFFFPTRLLGGTAARLAFTACGWSFPLPCADEAGGLRLVTDPLHWPEPSPPDDGRIRRTSDTGTLAWLARAGTEPRGFFGLLDEESAPLVRALGVYKKRAGIKACLLLDYQDHHPGGAGMGLLVRKLLDDPASGLDPATAMIVVSSFGAKPHHGAPGRRAGSHLYYHLPSPWHRHPRICLPVEGDLPLL